MEQGDAKREHKEETREGEKDDGVGMPVKYSFVDVGLCQEILSLDAPLVDFFPLQAVMYRFLRSPMSDDTEVALQGLKISIKAFNEHMRTKEGKTTYDFYHDLLPSIISWALHNPWHTEIQLLECGIENQVKLSATQVLFIMANSFFLNTLSVHGMWPSSEMGRAHHFGQLNFYQLYRRQDVLGVQRILCQLSYFEQMRQSDMEAEEKREVTFSRVHLKGASEEIAYKSGSIPLSKDITLLEDRMEAAMEAEGSGSATFVNFANEQLHIGKVIPSLTQEEVLFSCCPESFPGIMFCEVMEPNEIIRIDGTRRFSEYTGYLSTFRFTGFYRPKDAKYDRVCDSVAMDAVYCSHFTVASNDRDIGKAYLAFRTCHDKGQAVVTGHWGCGIFGGDKSHKFVQQIIAASAAGVPMRYCTFNQPETTKNLKEIMEALAAKNITTAQLYSIVIGYAESKKGFLQEWGFKKPPGFHTYLVEAIMKSDDY